MSGETDLTILIHSMTPKLLEQEYVFCTTEMSLAQAAEMSPLATFQEDEGLTLVLESSYSDVENLTCSGLFKCITLSVHSSLEAAGLTAAFARALAQQGISANVIAGFYHDHIFVPKADADRAMAALVAMTQE